MKPKWTYSVDKDDVRVVFEDGETFLISNGARPLMASEDKFKKALADLVDKRDQEHQAELAVREEFARLKDALQEVSEVIGRMSEAEANKPPQSAEWLFILFAPKQTAESQLGDLEELFQIDQRTIGPHRAQQRYWCRVLKCVVPMIYRKALAMGFISFLIDFGRRKLGL